MTTPVINDESFSTISRWVAVNFMINCEVTQCFMSARSRDGACHVALQPLTTIQPIGRLYNFYVICQRD